MSRVDHKHRINKINGNISTGMKSKKPGIIYENTSHIAALIHIWTLIQKQVSKNTQPTSDSITILMILVERQIMAVVKISFGHSKYVCYFRQQSTCVTLVHYKCWVASYTEISFWITVENCFSFPLKEQKGHFSDKNRDKITFYDFFLLHLT